MRLVLGVPVRANALEIMLVYASSELERKAYCLGGLARTGSRIVHMHCANVKFDFPGASMEKYQLAGFKVLQGLIRFDDAARLQVPSESPKVQQQKGFQV